MISRSKKAVFLLTSVFLVAVSLSIFSEKATPNTLPDTTPPAISNLQPVGPVGTDSDTALVIISADYQDDGSGINSASVSVQLDGTLLTGCNVTSSNVFCGPMSMNWGEHWFQINVTDNAGNPTVLTQTFQIASKNNIQCNDDISNGDCSKIGSWDTSTATFTLNTNTTCSWSAFWSDQSCIELTGPMIFDGNHYEISGNGRSNGIGAFRAAVIKNVAVSGFWSGILCWYGDSYVTIINNQLINNGTYGIGAGPSGGHYIKDNLISNSGTGIGLGGGNSTIINNTLTNNGGGIYAGGNSSVIENNFIGSSSGYGIDDRDSNTILGNDFVQNNVNLHHENYQSTFDHNYFDNFDAPSEGCSDINIDNFCDAPYFFDQGQDSHPKVTPNGVGNAGDLGTGLIPGDILNTADPAKGKWGEGLIAYGAIYDGKWKHVGMYIGDGKVIEATDQGATITELSSWVDPNASPNRKWVDYLRVKTDQFTRDRAVEFVKAQEKVVGKGYNYNYAFRDSTSGKNNWYCSELVWAAYINASKNSSTTIDLADASLDKVRQLPLSWQSVLFVPRVSETIQMHIGVSPSDIWNSHFVTNIGGHHEQEPLISLLKIIADCPVDLEVTDPQGRVTNISSNSIPGATYGRDIDENGRVRSWVGIPQREQGNYQISVVPWSVAQPTDTYSVRVDMENNSEVTLANEVSLSDANSYTYTFNSQPFDLPLSLRQSGTYWSSYADYTARLLSVNMAIANYGNNNAFGVQINNSSNTSGVLFASATPVLFGDITAGNQSTVTLKYEVPAGISMFRSSIFASANDPGGFSHQYP